MSAAAVVALALACDVAFGWPDRIYRRIGHPVEWIGALIAAIESRLNRGRRQRRRISGGLLVVAVLAVCVVPAIAVEAALPVGFAGVVAGAVLAWPWLAARSLHAHIAAVATPLLCEDLAGARRAVAKIVGRDPDRLDAAGVARAALESLAENASDAIVAPVFWALLGGLPGLVAYKAINTLDSMIGHRTERYEDFGKAAARLDDLVNLVPARVTALMIAIASGRPAAALAVVFRDANRHRSPNAGWPEAAMAGALNIRLSGPRVYSEGFSDEPWINAEAPDPDAGALMKGLGLYCWTLALLFGMLGLLAAA